jgi:hypothetical protein
LRSLKNFDDRKQTVRAAETKKAHILDAASNRASNILFFVTLFAQFSPILVVDYDW